MYKILGGGAGGGRLRVTLLYHRIKTLQGIFSLRAFVGTPIKILIGIALIRNRLFNLCVRLCYQGGVASFTEESVGVPTILFENRAANKKGFSERDFSVSFSMERISSIQKPISKPLITPTYNAHSIP
ncbi:hypothetical protein JWG44_09070 [Leptospira sp. 201903071]|uniref:hypothetical protein n=1 Tax=Leptospira ainazelensis TaxID=2810034 RepID=UPI00196437DD|nr:hypothetical protein [Leptospira ainazelensis]MBM9500395.1 hypothetical protein [Leptospira ainazelensis]